MKSHKLYFFNHILFVYLVFFVYNSNIKSTSIHESKTYCYQEGRVLNEKTDS